MSDFLTEHQFPEDLKSMNYDQLDLLSYAIRDFLIENVSKTGGHLASNLGVVELTIALHKVFDSPKDKIVWDVGHQSYVHKILTGRADQFTSLRKLNGLSGFPKAKESIHDVYDTGHSSTSISAAAGMAAARDINGDKNDVIAVIGDGSLTGGLAYEALNNVGTSKSNMLVILNDNGMSISRNIGGVSQHLSKLRTSNGYISAKKIIKRALSHIPSVGDSLSSNLGHAKDRLKYAILSGGVIFEELGFTYVGPIDGHDIKELVETLNLVRHAKGPVLVHVLTKKGKGFRTAEIEPNKFHGIAPFNPETGVLLKKTGVSYSDVFGKAALKLAEQNDSIVAITAAMCDATGLKEFSKKYPRRFFDVGIAEAHAVTFAAGLAKSGYKPIVAIYSSFLQRAYDQILEDVCYQNLPVIFAIDRAGIVGADGETHHGIFDLSYLSSMPNMTILTPKDGCQLRAMLQYASSLNGPVAIRYPRGECFDPGEGDWTYEPVNKRISSGKDVDIWAVGKMVYTAERARDLLKDKGIIAGVVDVTTIKPLDLSCLDRSSGLIVTLEDNIISGGFGEKMKASAEDTKIVSIGWPEDFIEHGSCEELYKKYGLNPESITERICDLLERKA